MGPGVNNVRSLPAGKRGRQDGVFIGSLNARGAGDLDVRVRFLEFGNHFIVGLNALLPPAQEIQLVSATANPANSSAAAAVIPLKFRCRTTWLFLSGW